MKRLLSIASLVLALALSGPPAHSQTRNALTVTACGGVTLWVPGAAGALTVDATGVLCTDSTGGGGSGLSFTTSTLAAWTSATAANATQTVMPITSTYGAAVIVQLAQTTTISAGAVTFEGTYDGTNWVTIPVAQVLNPNTFAPLTNPYTLVASTNQPFMILTQGYQGLRIKLSTQITGSGSVTPYVTLLPFLPVDPAILNPIAAGSAIIGKVGIDQTTPGTTNGVQALAGTTGGATPMGNIAANNTTAVVVKASAGTIFGMQLGNIGSVPAYLKIYNATSATCGSGTPIKRLIIPKAGTAADGGGSNIPIPATGISLSTGITYCVTGGIADNDTTAPAASTVLINIDFK